MPEAVPPRPPAPLRQRVAPLLGMLVGAAVSAEYLQAYLPETGDVLSLVSGLVVLGPLYGGAALLIREVALRAGLGWRGRLLLAAAFGLLMTSQVDGSLWQEHRPEIAYWDVLRSGTLVGPLGFAVFPLLTWVVGHVVFSVGAPLAVLDALAPRHRDRLLLGRVGLVVVGALCLGAALLIRADPGGGAQSGATATQRWVSLAVVLGLGALALTRLGRRTSSASGRAAPRAGRVLVVALLALTVLDLMPPTWLGVGGYLVVLAAGVVLLARASGAAGWGVGQTTALGVAAVVERTALGVVAPLPDGVSLAEKAVQSVVLGLVVVAVSALAWRAASVTGRAARDAV